MSGINGVNQSQGVLPIQNPDNLEQGAGVAAPKTVSRGFINQETMSVKEGRPDVLPLAARTDHPPVIPPAQNSHVVSYAAADVAKSAMDKIGPKLGMTQGQIAEVKANIDATKNTISDEGKAAINTLAGIPGAEPPLTDAELENAMAQIMMKLDESKQKTTEEGIKISAEQKQQKIQENVDKIKENIRKANEEGAGGDFASLPDGKKAGYVLLCIFCPAVAVYELGAMAVSAILHEINPDLFDKNGGTILHAMAKPHNETAKAAEEEISTAEKELVRLSGLHPDDNKASHSEKKPPQTIEEVSQTGMELAVTGDDRLEQRKAFLKSQTEQKQAEEQKETLNAALEALQGKDPKAVKEALKSAGMGSEGSTLVDQLQSTAEASTTIRQETQQQEVAAQEQLADLARARKF